MKDFVHEGVLVSADWSRGRTNVTKMQTAVSRRSAVPRNAEKHVWMRASHGDAPNAPLGRNPRRNKTRMGVCSANVLKAAKQGSVALVPLDVSKMPLVAPHASVSHHPIARNGWHATALVSVDIRGTSLDAVLVSVVAHGCPVQNQDAHLDASLGRESMFKQWLAALVAPVSVHYKSEQLFDYNSLLSAKFL